MKTCNLSGALLDYYVARAEGVPAAELEIRATGTLCVRNLRGDWGPTVAVIVQDYSTNWALSGPLLEKNKMDVESPDYAHSPWIASVYAQRRHARVFGHGETPLIAICRAVVRAAFGDEVEDLP